MLTTELPFNRQETLYLPVPVQWLRGKPPFSASTGLQRKHTLSSNPIHTWIFSSAAQAANQTAIILHLGNVSTH